MPESESYMLSIALRSTMAAGMTRSHVRRQAWSTVPHDSMVPFGQHCRSGHSHSVTPLEGLQTTALAMFGAV